MTRRRLASLVGLCLLGLIVLMPTAIVMTLASTESGLRLVAAKLKQVGRVRIDATGVEGTLTGGFRIERLVIDNPWVHLEFTRVAGTAEVLPLLWQTIDLPALQADDALIQVKPPPPRRAGAIPTRMRFLPGALRIDANRLVLGQGALLLANGTRYDATGLEAAAVIRSGEIRLLRGGMDLPYVHVQTSGRLLAGTPLALNGQARLNIHAEGQPDWILHGEFDGDLEELPISASLTAPFRADFQGRAVDLSGGWRWRGAAVVDDLDIRAFGGGGALGLIRGTLTIGGDRNGYTANGQLEPLGLRAGPFAVDARGSYAQRVLTLGSVLLDHAPSGAHAAVRGTVTVQDGGPLLQLEGDWSRFRWPLPSDDPATRSERGRFTLSGVKDYDVVASGEFAPADLPSMPATLRGLLSGDRFAIREAHVDSFGGRTSLTGEARWSPQESWSLRGNAVGIDTRQLRAEVPGQIDVDFTATGRGFDPAGEVDLGIQRLTGRVRGMPARGSGTVERRGAPDARSWRFAGVDMRVGGSRVMLEGATRAPRDLRFDLASDDLSLLSADLRGRITARGRLAGDERDPLLRLEASGRGFEWQDNRLARLEADLDVQLGEGGITRGTLQASDLLLAGRRVEDVKVDLSGTASANTIGVNVSAPPVAIALRARGAYIDARWRGVVDSFDLGEGDSLALRLTEFAPLTIGDGTFSLGRACLEGGEAKLCLQGDHGGREWRANALARNFPLRALTAGLSRDTRYEGRVALDLDAHGGAGAMTDAVLRARLDGAEVNQRLPNGREERIRLGNGTVEGTLEDERFSARVGLEAGDSGRLKGELAGRRTGSDWRDWQVRGSAELATDALGLIDLLVTDADRVAGRITAHADIDGTLGAPALRGDLQVRGGELDFYQVSLGIRDIDFDARLSDRAIELGGTLRAGSGNARIDGRIAWSGGEPDGRLTLKGERLQVVNVPEAQIVASPDIAFRIQGRRIDVTGSVDVPEAHLDPADLTNAALPSGDERLVGAAPRDPERQFQVVSNIHLQLGDEVSINTYGLTGKLTGAIDARSDENDVTRASGELNVSEGRYTAFGRNLDIERGRLLFNNGLVADPAIDLRAQKVFPDITAGVNVRGTLRAPRMTFFSEPSIPQSQIVSLILAGGSLESVQNGDRRGAARNDLLAQGGAILAQQFGSRVGIEDVGIESDRTNETSLVLGKYLSPRLYVSYGISLAEAINTVKLRYTIGDRWTLKTESGRARSADIVYTIRK